MPSLKNYPGVYPFPTRLLSKHYKNYDHPLPSLMLSLDTLGLECFGGIGEDVNSQ
jgi:hypothetical protein